MQKNIKKIIDIMKENDCINIEIIVCNTHSQVFTDIVQTLKNQLTDEGISVTIANTVTKSKKNTFYILFNQHQDYKFFDFSLKYAIFNYEQAGSNYVKNNLYLSKMAMGNVIFDYSNYNKKFLEQNVNKPVHVIPFSYHPSLTVLDIDRSDSEQFDILFYGCMNQHRQNYYGILKNGGYKVNFISDYGYFGEKLIEEWKKYKIVLNVHYYTNPSVLEISRIVPLIANHKLVFSERSDDLDADKRFENMVVFVDENTILDECKKYLSDPLVRLNKISQAFAILSEES